MGALLLFVTNVAAILVTGTVVMAIYGTYRLSTTVGGFATLRRGRPLALIAVMVMLVGIPLTHSSLRIARDSADQARIEQAGEDWAQSVDWELVAVDLGPERFVAEFEGSLPYPDTDSLRDTLLEAGIDPGRVRVEMSPRTSIDYA